MGESAERRDGQLVAVIALNALLVLGIAALLVVAVVTRRDGGDEAADGRELPALAAAFTAEELTADPTDMWITNGGTLANQRYSPLDEIDADNVADLKGVWMTDLDSATAAKYSAEGQPIVYDGMIYIPTGDDDVFAVDVETGAIRWKYESDIDRGSPRSVAAGSVAASPSARARSTSASSTASSSRSTRRPAGKLGDGGRQAAPRAHDHRCTAVLRRHGHHRRVRW